MKKLFPFLTIVLASTFFISCTKTQLDASSNSAQISASKIKPYVLQCGSGQHWDYYLHKCVNDCPTGYHNDSITGACVIDGGGGGTTNITVVTNPNNPDEIVGQNHNLGMSTIMPNYSNGNLQPTEQNVLAYTKSFLSSKSYDIIAFNNSYNYEKQNFDSTILQQNSITYESYNLV